MAGASRTAGAAGAMGAGTSGMTRVSWAIVGATTKGLLNKAKLPNTPNPRCNKGVFSDLTDGRLMV